MKRNSLTFIIGLLLLLVFVFMLFFFQVRQTEIALVTRFGKPTRSINVDPERPDPGLHFKLPWPIERVQYFDKRIQDFDGKFEETLTQDHYPILISVYAGWVISDATLFRNRFDGSVARAETQLESLIFSEKKEVVGNQPFSHFISTDAKELKFTEIEQQILAKVQPLARANYGIDVQFLGIKRLGLPEAITQNVFDRMKAERQRVVQVRQAEGENQARDIRSDADLTRTRILAGADARVKEIQGQAEAEVSASLKVFEENPELAIFLLKVDALGAAAKEHSTLILDQRTPPFDLLDGAAKGVTNFTLPNPGKK
ncbi:MAG TPA: protease modulator HflC [Dongiaceae bacterium]|nr:protease modulator HflC [Dongiaceae bacterium]